jgi:hypothetical protein
MPGTAVNVGTGTTITFGTSGYSANILSVSWDGIERQMFDSSHMGTAAPGANKFGNKTFIASKLSDPGTLTLEVHHNPQTNPPVDGAFETVTVTWPQVSGDSTAASWAGSGAIQSYRVNDPHDGIMSATMVVKFSGNVTMTDAT